MRLAARAFVWMAAAILILTPRPAGAQTELPSAPVNLAASIANDVLTVTWDAPTVGAPIVAYVLQVVGTGLGTGVSIPTVTRSLTTPLPAGFAGFFAFAVSAVNIVGQGPASATVTVGPGAQVLPSAPRNLAASVANEVLTITWDAPLNGAPIDSYVLHAAGPGLGGGLQLPTAATSFSTPFPNGVIGTFTFAVSAVNVVGPGPLSPAVSISIGPTSVPVAPQNVRGGVTNDVLTLTWDAPARGGPIVSYVLSIGGSGLGARLPLPSVATSYSTPLPNTYVGTFAVTVSAVNQLGEGPPIAVFMLILGPTAVPDPPRNFTAQVVGNVLTVAWQPPVSGALSYVLRATGSSFQGVWTLPTTATSFTASADQMAHGNYAFTVSAVNTLGESAATAPASVTIGPPCPLPSAPTLSASRNGNVVSLSWTTPAVGVVTSYSLLVSTPGGGVNQTAANVGLVTTLAGPVPSGTYFVHVQGQSACGPGAASNQERVDVP